MAHTTALTGHRQGPARHAPLALDRRAAHRPQARAATRCLPPRCDTASESAASQQPCQLSRRLLAAAGAAALLGLPSLPAAAEAQPDALGSEDTGSAPASPPDTSITHKVYFDIGICQQGFQGNRTLGDNAFCKDPESLGRVTIGWQRLQQQQALPLQASSRLGSSAQAPAEGGARLSWPAAPAQGLYGNLVPRTVENFLALVQSGAYNSTMFSKVLPGEYVVAGKQGSPRMGEVALSTQQLPPNEDLLAAGSFALTHSRPGTVSLNLSHNEDEASLQASRAYRNVSFLITTGPGPASSLDGQNVVFGRVLAGMDAVSRLTNVPTFKPLNGRLLALNRLGSMMGDERADKAKRKWGKPLKPVLITDSGVLA